MHKSKKIILLIVLVLILGYGAKNIFAQKSESILYVPLVGISSVPDPLALPMGSGNVTYRYSVKNFLREVALANIQVVDNKCSPVKFLEGDDNQNLKLDYDETWRYSCTMKIYETTQSVATVTGTVNNLSATHKAYTTVFVGSDSDIVPPLVNIINITKISYPLSLPIGGGDITFTYKVNNPGVVPLNNISVVDDKCRAMSSKLGDTNGNNLLDINEVWVYSCTTHLIQTTTNTVSVEAYSNNLKAVGYATITVTVASPVPGLPLTGIGTNFKTIVWLILIGVLVILIVFFFITQKHRLKK